MLLVDSGSEMTGLHAMHVYIMVKNITNYIVNMRYHHDFHHFLKS